MFQSSLNQQPQSLIHRKKQIFHEMIRKKERQAIINKLRKNAQLPDYLQQFLLDLPKSIHELISKIRNQELEQWGETIADSILDRMNGRLLDLFEEKSLSEFDLIILFFFLLKQGNKEEELYKEHFGYLRKRSDHWAHPQRIKLFMIFNFMLKKGHSFVLQDAKQFHSTLKANRFYDSQLHFYNIIIKKYPEPENLAVFLSHQTLKRLSVQVQVHFYSQTQKIDMLEILIQVLYVSTELQITKCFDLEGIFDNCEYFISYNNKNKMLIDRSILLIYNINVDASSKPFLSHKCFKVIVCEMKNRNNPNKLRSLMAELFLNSIFHYPQQSYYLFLKSNISWIFADIQFILQEFAHVQDIQQITLQLLRSIFAVTQQEEFQLNNSPILAYLKAHKSFSNAIKGIDDSQTIFQEFPILSGLDSL